MAAEDFDARSGGVQGVPVQVAPEDDAGKANQAASLATQLAADRTVLGVVGPMTSAAALAAGPILDAAHVAFITQSAANPKITASGWKTAHRLVARDDQQGPADAVFLFGPPANAKNVYVLDSKEPYSISLADEFEKRAKALGVTVERDSLPAAGAGYAIPVGKAKDVKADALFFPDQGSQCAAVLQEMRKQSVSFKLMSSDGCHDNERFIATAGGAAEGMFVSDSSANYDATPEGQAWAKDFKAKFGADPALFSSYAYDAARITLQAIQNAATLKGSLDVTPADVNVEIVKTKGFKGLLGPISFDSRGDVENAAVYIYQVVGGEFKRVKTQ
jgi:branched-chain amino acid transport system substrate-binding protein